MTTAIVACLLAALALTATAQPEDYKPPCQCNTFEACVQRKFLKYEECALRTCVRENMDAMHVNWMGCWSDIPNQQQQLIQCIQGQVGKKCVNRAKRQTYTPSEMLNAFYGVHQQQQQQQQPAAPLYGRAYYTQQQQDSYNGYMQQQQQQQQAFQQQQPFQPYAELEPNGEADLSLQTLIPAMQDYAQQWSDYAKCVNQCTNETDAFNTYRGGEPERRLSPFTSCAKELNCVMNAAEWGDITEAAKTCSRALGISWRQQAEQHCQCIEAASLQRQRDTHPPCELLLSYLDMIDDDTLNDIMANVAAFFNVEHQIII